MIALALLGGLFSHADAQSLPALPSLYLGFNQPGLSSPSGPIDPYKPWALSDAELVQLKAELGMTTIRFPLYPSEVGLDNQLVAGWDKGQTWNEGIANGWPVNWLALDAVLDQMVRMQLTPIICPVAEPPKDWVTMHIPEAAERALWFTRLVAGHVHGKYGDNVVYGWYENFAGVSYMHDRSTQFPAQFRQRLSEMYGGSIASLNTAWNGAFASFGDVPVPRMWDGSRVPADAIESRRTYDLRKAMDLLGRDRLTAWRTELSQIAPGAKWIGGCLHDGFNGMYDTRTVKPPRCTASIRTLAKNGDHLSADNYLLSGVMKTDYRTIAKIANSEGKKLFVSEVLSWSGPSFNAIAEVGGPLQGVLAWCGKEDMFGLITLDGTRREGSIAALAQLFQTIRGNTAKYSTYAAGRVRVLFPETAYEYMLSSRSYLDAYEHICDSLSPADLEPVLESELLSLPENAYLFVFEQNLQRTTINTINRLGSRLVCPHSYFIDEGGNHVNRTWMPADFNAQLASVPDGPALSAAFRRIDDQLRNSGSGYNGAIARTTSQLAPGLGWDNNIVWNAVDGSINSEVRFADIAQQEIINLEFRDPKTVDGVFVQFYPGSVVGDTRSIPARIRISVSSNGTTWTQVASTTNISSDRMRLAFASVSATHVRFDFGSNTDSVGTRVIDLGVLEHSN